MIRKFVEWRIVLIDDNDKESLFPFAFKTKKDALAEFNTMLELGDEREEPVAGYIRQALISLNGLNKK